MSESNKRKVLLINPKFQISFLSFTIGVTLLIILVNYFAIEYFFHKFNKIGESLGLAQGHAFFTFIAEQKSSMSFVFLITAVLSFILLLVTGLYLSHRVAGPLYRLHRHMNDVAEGKTSADVKFRNKDYFNELAEAYNKQLKRFLR